MNDKENPMYKKTWFLILMFLLGLTLLQVIGVSEDILTAITIIVIISFVIKLYIKNKQKQQEIKDKELDLINQGYKKICSNFFVDEENYRVNILDNIYGFSQIIEDKIKELGKLYKEGLLTEYEFATKKMELLEKLKK